jgi:hypothetical protein
MGSRVPWLKAVGEQAGKMQTDAGIWPPSLPILPRSRVRAAAAVHKLGIALGVLGSGSAERTTANSTVAGPLSLFSKTYRFFHLSLSLSRL